MVSRAMAKPQGGQHRADWIWRTRHIGRISPESAGSLFPLLPSRKGRKAGVAGDNLSERIEYLEDVCGLAPETSPANQAVLTRGRFAFLHRSRVRQDARLPRVHFRSDESRALSAEAHLTHLSWRRLAPLGGGGPAFCGSPPGRSNLYQRASARRLGCNR